MWLIWLLIGHLLLFVPYIIGLLMSSQYAIYWLLFPVLSGFVSFLISIGFLISILFRSLKTEQDAAPNPQLEEH